MNKVILIGRTGKDPEVRHLESGKVVATFSLATDKRYKNANGERINETTWHNIVIWGKLAEVAEKWVKKGNSLMVEGSIINRSYEKDGVKKFITEIVADNFEMLGSKPETSQSDKSDDPGLPPGDIGGQDYKSDKDDLPFAWILPFIGIGTTLIFNGSNLLS